MILQALRKSPNYLSSFPCLLKYHYSSKNVNIKPQKTKSHPIVVIGGSAIDMTISPASSKGLVFGRTNEGRIHSSYGGVGRNISQVVGRLGINAALITALGQDIEAQNIRGYMQSTNVDVYPIYTSSENTGRYIHATDKGQDILFGLSDMKVNDHLTFEKIYEAYFKDHEVDENTIVQLDSCITAEELSKLVPYLNENRVRIFLEGIGNKVLRIFESGCLDQINQLKINRQEGEILAENLQVEGINGKEDVEGVKKHILNVIGKKSLYKSKDGREHRAVVFTKGGAGIEGYLNDDKYDLPVVGVSKVVKTNGAGDTLTGALLSSLHRGSTFRQSLIYGMCGSKITIQSPIAKSTIPEHITRESLDRIRALQKSYDSN